MQIRIILAIFLIFQFSTGILSQAQSKKTPVKKTQTQVKKTPVKTAKTSAPSSALKSQSPQSANENGKKVQSSIARNGLSFMFAGTNDISNTGKERWVGILLENALEFKCSAVSALGLVMSNEVFTNIPGFGSIAAPPTEREYLDVAKKLKVTYIGKAKYDLTDSKNIDYYLEIISVQDGSLTATIERSFKLEKMGVEVDAIVNELIKSLKITQSPDLVRFLRYSALSEDTKNMKTIGEYLFNSRFSSKVDKSLTVDNFRNICSRDKAMVLAFWYGGMIFENAGQNIEAIEAFKTLNQIFPEFLPAYAPLSRVNRKAGRFENSQSFISLGEQRGIKTVEFLVEKALTYKALKKNFEAETVFKQILASAPDNPVALLNYARKCNDEGRGKEASDACNRFLKGNKPGAEIFIELGRSFILLSNKSAAINAFTRASQLDTKNPVPFVSLGDLYLSGKSYAEASRCYDKAIILSPDDVDLAVNASRAFQASGNSKKSLDLLRKMEEKNPQHAALNGDLGLLEYSIKENNKAILHLENAYRAGITDQQLLAALGLLYVDTKQYVKALPLLNKALPLVKDKTLCKVGLAKIQLGLADTDAAVKILDDLALQKVSIPDAYLLVAEKYYSQGDKKRSYEYYKKEYAQNKNNIDVVKKVADLSYEFSLWQECKSALVVLSAKDSKNSQLLYRLAIVSLQLKDRDGASAYVKKAAQFGNADADVYFMLGQGFKALDAPRDAAIAYQKCVSANPSNEKALTELAFLLEKMGKDSAAADANLKLFDVNNDKYKERLVAAAQLFEKSKAYNQARNACSLFLKKNYVNSEITLQLIRLEYNAKNFSNITSLSSTVPVSKLDTMMLRICAESFSNLQQYKKVTVYTSAMLQKVPSSVWATELGAVANDKNGAFETAVTMYKKYITLTNKYQTYGMRVGELYEQLKQYKAATEHYELLSKNLPKDWKLPEHLARLYYKSKDWKNTIDKSKAALAFSGAPADLNLLIGRSNAALNNKTGTVEGYTKYLRAFESDTAVLVEFGIKSFNNADYNNSIKAFSNALRFRADNFTIRKCLGISFVKTGNQAQAVKHLEKALEYQNDDKEVIALLTSCYKTSGDKSSVISALKNLCNIDRTNLDARKQLGDMLLADSQFNDAAPVFEQAALLENCPAETHLKLATIYSKINKQELVGGQLRSAMGCDSKNPEIYYQLYIYFNSINDSDRAMDYLRQAINMGPLHSGANLKLGQMLLDKNRPAEAVEYISRSVKNKPDVANKTALVEALYKVNRYDEALKYARSIITPGCTDPQILKWGGFAMKATGRTDTAAYLLEKAVQIDHNCGQCYNFLGDIYFERGSYSEAVENYKAAAGMAGFSESVAFKIGRVNSIAGREEQARQAFESIIAKKPNNMEAWYRLMHSYIDSKQYDACRALFSRVANDQSGWVSLAKGELLEAEGQLEAAFKAWEVAFSTLPPDNTEMQAALGRFCLKNSDYAAAIEYFGKAMAGDPENCQYMLDLGKAYEGTRNFSTALDLYKEVKRRRPDFPEVAALITRVANK